MGQSDGLYLNNGRVKLMQLKWSFYGLNDVTGEVAVWKTTWNYLTSYTKGVTLKQIGTTSCKEWLKNNFFKRFYHFKPGEEKINFFKRFYSFALGEDVDHAEDGWGWVGTV